IPGLKLTVVSTDGQEVEPVEVDEFRIGPGETYDVFVRMPDDRAYTIFAQSLDRTGFARGTLAPRVGMEADVPELDEPVWLSEVDMMGAMVMSAANAQAGITSMNASRSAASGHRGHGGSPDLQKANHARTEYGSAVDMRVDYPRNNLDDPG